MGDLNFIFDRIDREEKFLITVFGKKYIDYMKQTKIIVPFIF